MFLYKHDQFQFVVTVIVLGQCLGNDCLATPKSPRNGTCTWDIRCVISIMPAPGTVTVLTVTVLTVILVTVSVLTVTVLTVFTVTILLIC